MANEASKALKRRLRDPVWQTHYMVGDAIDIGAGRDGLSRQREHWPRLTSVRDWDIEDGDAQLMEGVADGSFDVVHSSHCLEHMRDPFAAIYNWWRILRPGGHLTVIVPDEDMYEQGQWPSRFNPDHKRTFTVLKNFRSWSQQSISIFALLAELGDEQELLELRSLHSTHEWDAPFGDQTLGAGECAIEFVVRKRPPWELAAGGRLRRAV
jgi:SAM-dependent methyltransferase